MDAVYRAVVVSTMVCVAVALYVVQDVSPQICSYLMWAFSAAALMQAPEPSPPEPPLSELKLRWRGHLK